MYRHKIKFSFIYIEDIDHQKYAVQYFKKGAEIFIYLEKEQHFLFLMYKIEFTIAQFCGRYYSLALSANKRPQLSVYNAPAQSCFLLSNKNTKSIKYENVGNLSFTATSSSYAYNHYNL